MPTTKALILPATIRPIKYWIELQPHLGKFNFQGMETIDIQVLESTSQVVLNAIELLIESATLSRDGTETIVCRITLDESLETVTLNFGDIVPSGPARLNIKFTGELNDKLRGFYRSQYITTEGEHKYLATTQFEATDARRAFPCWDEPACKAKFDVTLVIPENLVAISNTPVVAERSVGEGMKFVRFAETPLMSTYLLAFSVGDFVSVEQQAANNTKVSVWTIRGKEDQGQFALDTSVKLLAFFNDYFGIPYPLEKLDHIAVPDFAAGAMENWGAIIYRETALLVDPANSSAGTRQRVAEVIAHEMAHMWFGDLVTMHWWDDLWLNESFASWMGNKAVDWLFPDWQMWTQFVSMDTNRALSLDGLNNSHPIEQEVNNPAEVGQMFDAISYSKGASVIRMLEQFLGAATFQRGLNRYFSLHQYGNARTKDLWLAMEESSNQPVTSIMNTWTKQMGYPVLSVETRQDTDNRELNIYQERFVYDSIDETGLSKPSIWQVPLEVAYSGAANPAFLQMNDKRACLRLKGSDQPAPGRKWFKLNPSQTGFYRVKYLPEDLDNLLPVIQSLELPAVDRLGIQNDAWALCRAGLQPIKQFLSLLRAYHNENDASVWGDLAVNMREIDTLVAAGTYHAAYQEFARKLFKPAALRLGWEPQDQEQHLDALQRSIVLAQVGGYGDTETLNEAKERFERFLQGFENIHPDIRGVVFGLVGHSGDRDTYDKLWKLERSATLQEEKVRLLQALTRFSRTELLQETLERSMSSDVRSQDTIGVVAGVAANIHGREVAWEFIKSNWPEFDRRYGAGGFGLMRLVAICGNFSSAEKLAEVGQFFEEHPTPSADRTIRQALERVRLNIGWLDRNQDDLKSWFGP
jgi:puromycin-sensitive aminopeptidase